MGYARLDIISGWPTQKKGVNPGEVGKVPEYFAFLYLLATITSKRDVEQKTWKP